MTQLTFDDAIQQRDAALFRVEHNADTEELARWWDALKYFAARHVEVFCDDFQAETLRYLPPLREPRAIGALFRRASREKLIEKTGQYLPSVRSHLAAKPVWRSLIYRGSGAE